MGEAYPSLEERAKRSSMGVEAERRSSRGPSRGLPAADRAHRRGPTDQRGRCVPAARHVRLPDRPDDRGGRGARRDRCPRGIRCAMAEQRRAFARRAPRRRRARSRGRRVGSDSSAIRTRRAPTTCGCSPPFRVNRGVVLDRTPFYAEGGGQIGDRGELIGPTGRPRRDRYPARRDAIVHLGSLEGSFSAGDRLSRAEVDEARRWACGEESHGHPPAASGPARRARREREAGGLLVGPKGCASTSPRAPRRRARRCARSSGS